MDTTMRLLYPLIFLKPSDSLLDPSNLETVWEYYLLENISCGLVRDSKDALSSYEGCVASRFYQEDSSSWTFTIREMKWSDGTPVTDFEIQAWAQSLRTQSNRHLKIIKRATEIVFDPNTRTIRIRFPFSVDECILHELSLADAGLFPTNYLEHGWKKTIGPYFVEKWEPTNNLLTLSANSYSPLFSKEMPARVHFSRLLDTSQRPNLFKSVNVDLLPITSTTSPNIINQVRPNVSNIFTSHPIAISFFYFNHNNPQSRILSNRETFAAIVSEVKENLIKSTSNGFAFFPENQMVPKGFSGRLESYEKRFKVNHNFPKNITVALWPSFQDYPMLIESIKNAFASYGVKLKIDFSDKETFSDDDFAGMYTFLGNQLDSSGSWSFLTSPPKGLLFPWLNQIKAVYEMSFQSDDYINRESNLRLLHKAVLENALVVPLMIGSQRYFLSSRIDTTKWNSFDSRLRLNELKFK